MIEYIKKTNIFNKQLADFIIFSPEPTFLRRFEDDEKIKPLGIKGEGLFKLLKILNKQNDLAIKKMKDYLKLFDWFKGFEFPKEILEGEKYLNIEDKYISKGIDFIHQYSANEGFLFLLFYLSLFISNDTPSFFAIDNIEASLNPRLCGEAIKILNTLSKENKKQVIMSTHNPFILDGLDLKDNEQKLFIIRRNADGYTIATRIEYTESKCNLSEAWMRGYIGGLPQNF